MIELHFIGNLTKDPESRVTSGGVNVTNFNVAVNRKVNGEEKPMYIRVSAWRALGESCAKYLAKGKKVYVCGLPDARAYKGNDGEARADIQCIASMVEFLSAAQKEPPRGEADESNLPKDPESGFAMVPEDDLPF